MNKFHKIIKLTLVCLPLSGYAISLNGSYQAVTTNQQNEMKQEKANGNTQALNNLRIDGNTVSIQNQTVKAKKETKMTQTDGRNSIQALNNATVTKNAVVIQRADLEKLKMHQKGGRNNTQAVNNLHIKK